MRIINAEKFIENTLRHYIRDIIKNTCYRYLDCRYYQWKDADGVIHELNSMSERYLNNCLKRIESDKIYCQSEDGKEYGVEGLQISLDEKLSMDTLVKDKLKNAIKEEILERLEDKEKEIRREINNR
ncbi:TPA: hypothetical protein ACF2DS_001265 [Clostridium perfringens]|uniref:hypothetical protein n=1 Tax=Clostridium perfringens TaxID=1502 RepID=UPI0018A8FA9B|nr:hypothetical protein [Clostridium perfringens]EHR1327346.1 hypothetical protein [Clostridium perfringens]EHR1330479.1 hypothetical protein [Clostridium perfringens]EHR1423956.1 hypothetical protein [Clostridium perfringens]EIF6165433.1 hypothetical protein [Clostridium perfringens]MBI5985935.1 hypothetical protein [Clostridium perfringens]